MPPVDQSPESSEACAPHAAMAVSQPAASKENAAGDFRTLSKRSSQFMGGTICLFLLGFVSFPILARIFTIEDYGLISLVYNTVAVAVVFSKFGLQTAVQRFYKEHAVSPEPGVLRGYYSTVYLGAAGNGLLVTALFVLILWALPASVIGPRMRLALAVAAGLILVRSISSMITNLLQVEGRIFAWNLMQILTKAGTIALTVSLLLLWSRSPVVLFLGTIVVESSAVLLAIPYLRRRRMLAISVFNKRIFREIMFFGLPMMGVELFALILDSGDRFLVQGFLGARQLGFYSAAYNISGYIRESLSRPLSMALFPIVMEIWVLKGREKTQEFLGRSMNNFVLVGIAVVALASACSSDAINLLASPKYHEAHRLLPYILVGMLVNSVAMFLKAGLLIHKKTFLMMKIVMFSCLLNILMNVILLPRIGLLGAAIATLASFAFSTGLYAWHSRKHLPLHVNWLAWFRYAAVGCFTWFLITQFEIHSLLLSLVVRGTVGLFLYAAVLWLIDSNVRTLISNVSVFATDWLRQLQAPRSATAE